MNRSAAYQRKQKTNDGLTDLGDVSVHLRGCSGGSVGIGGISLNNLVEFDDGLADLTDPLGLFPGGGRHLPDQLADLLTPLGDFREFSVSLGRQIGPVSDLADGTLDQ
jgi:hypothetical protein